MLFIIVLLFCLFIQWSLNTIGITQIDDIAMLPFILLFSITLLYEIRKGKVTKKFSIEISFGYILRVFFLFFDLYGRNIYILPTSGNDSEMFYAESVKYITGINARESLFIELFGTLFKWFGTSRLFWQYILTLTSIVAIVYLMKTLEYIDIDDRTKHVACWVVCLLPNYAMQSVVFLREATISMCVAISAYLFVKWMYEKKEVSYIFSIIFCVLGAVLHSGIVGLAIGYIVMRFIYDKKNECYHVTPENIIVSAVLVFGAAFVYLNYGSELFPYLSRANNLETMATGEGSGGSTYAQYVGNSSTPLNMIIYTIPRIVYFLFSPFIWQWREISDIIATVFNAMFYIITVWDIIRYLISKEKANRNVLIALVIAAFCTVLIYGWGVSNTGTAVRHRDKMFTYYVLMWACCNSSNTIKLRVKI